MTNASGWNEHGRTRRKLHDDFEVKENQMTSKVVVIGSQGSECANTMGDVSKVGMFKCDGARPTVEGDGREHTVSKVVHQLRMVREQGVHFLVQILKKQGEKCSQCA